MKRLVLILFLVSVCWGDTFTSHLKPIADGTLDIGTSSLLWQYIYGDAFTDGTALWDSSNLSGFTNITGTTITGDTLTDGTFVVSGGEISAGEIVATFGDIDIGGNTLTSWDIYTGQIIAHSTTDPQLLLRHTTGVDEASFYVDSNGDLTIQPSRNIIFEPNDTDTTTFFQVLDADGGIPILNVDSTNERVGIGTASPVQQFHLTGNIQMENSAFIKGKTDGGIVANILWTDGSNVLNIRAISSAGIWIRDSDNRLSTFFKNGGNVGIGGEAAAETLTEWTHAQPYLTLHNSTHEDSDGGRESRLNFKGEQSGEEETTLARIEVGHDGIVDDEKGYWDLFINDGDDGDTPTHTVRIDTVGLRMQDNKLIAADVNAGITASTTQSQGQGALTAQVNEISTVANKDDTVTLPTAVTGIIIEIINNGANTLLIFPASGDDLGLGVDAAEELEANERVMFVAYTTTNWAKESTTEIIHAEIHDEDNTDAFVINDAGGDFHSYHTNGLVAGDLADWTFDAGGGGTSFPIASIANSAGSPGTQILVTTTGDHGLAVGDIISQTNLADVAYVGIFEVKATALATTYEVTALYTATGTGTMDQAATITADAVAAGVYDFAYYISAKIVGNNETFDFQLYNEVTAITGSKIRRKFGAANDFGSMSGGGVGFVGNGEKISFALSNEDSAANIIIRNLTIVLVRL